MRTLVCLAFAACFLASYPVVAEESSFNTVIFCCSELVPDLKSILPEDSGQIVVVSNMGNVVPVGGLIPDHIEVGSVEYAVEHGADKIIVIGHKGCKIIKSVMDCPTGRGNQPAIYAVLSKSITQARKYSGDSDAVWRKAVEYNVMNTVNELRENRFVLHDLFLSGKLKVDGVVYDSETGKLEYISK